MINTYSFFLHIQSINFTILFHFQSQLQFGHLFSISFHKCVPLPSYSFYLQKFQSIFSNYLLSASAGELISSWANFEFCISIISSYFIIILRMTSIRFECIWILYSLPSHSLTNFIMSGHWIGVAFCSALNWCMSIFSCNPLNDDSKFSMI